MRLPLVCTALLLAVAPAASGAPVLAPLKPCYVSVAAGNGKFQTEPVTVQGSGFAPGARIDVAVDGEDVQRNVIADANGAISGTVAAPGIVDGERVFSVRATQVPDTTQTASVQARVTNLTARLSPRRSSPRRKVRFTGQGFTDPDAPVYAHYVRAGSDEARMTVKLRKRPAGACGHFSVRKRQFPFAPKAGGWIVRIDQAPRLGADLPAVDVFVRVRKAT
jgi:hypothetical protein